MERGLYCPLRVTRSVARTPLTLEELSNSKILRRLGKLGQRRGEAIPEDLFDRSIPKEPDFRKDEVMPVGRDRLL